MIIKFIKQIKENREKKELKIQRAKFLEIRLQFIKYFEDLQATKGTIEIPAFMLADSVIKEVIKSRKDVDFYWNLIKNYRPDLKLNS